MGITSDQAAGLLYIAGGALRSIEIGIKPASLALTYRAARLYQCDVDDLLLASDDGVPDNPPSRKQEPETNVGPGRKDTEKRAAPKGPKRFARGAA